MKKMLFIAGIILVVVGSVIGVVMANQPAPESETIVETTIAATEEVTEEPTETTPATESATQAPTQKSTESKKKTTTTTTNDIPQEYYSDASYNGSSDQHVASRGADGSVTYNVQKPSRTTSTSTADAPMPQAGSNVDESPATEAVPTEVVDYTFPEPETEAPATEAAPAPEAAAGAPEYYTVFVGDTQYVIPADEFNPDDWAGFDIVA